MLKNEIDSRLLLEEGRRIILREAALLDDALWDEWLALYTPDSVFWMPTWRRCGTLTEDPGNEVSHIHVVGHAGFQERIMRIRSGRAAASRPLQRTSHLLSGTQFLEDPRSDFMRLRTAWVSHVYFPLAHVMETFFGHYEHDLQLQREWKIARKKVVLKNDYLPTMADFYCV
ncbi:aromatic-ring-hydroxylating dioxygenase subunit beta [Sphingobium sp.]|uniref:aromatic-ring-hydroxylating dioxygenase subunit beta n=1 Tax=Sphingobium sp. TaxID=1912891 RepID=UPI0028BE89BF|nr:aromatic-ring-hydroxylating dioxygenase subunit beta [Sphingobium sp.]